MANEQLGRGTAACTIIAKNYLAQARVLARSFKREHPDSGMFVLVIDDIEGFVDASQEPFETLTLGELAIPDVQSLCFKYTVMELATAVKPFLLQFLLDRRGVQRLLYLDPDIQVTSDLSQLFERLLQKSIMLTPHITRAIDDGSFASEVRIMQSGTYNLGFIGISDTPTTREMLAWWQKRCHDHCVSRPEQGLFVDQKWIDLVPGLFGDVDVIREPGYNVAYWNLHEREVTINSPPLVNGQTLRFFHFSGYDPDKPHIVSKHQTRFNMNEVGDAERLFGEYGRRLGEEGYHESIRWPYSFDAFDNGVRILPLMRDLYYRLGSQREAFGDPFVTRGDNTFSRWMNAPAPGEPQSPPYVSHLAAHCWEIREDLRQTFPEYRGAQRASFLRWFASDGIAYFGLDSVTAEEIRRQASGNRIPEQAIAPRATAISNSAHCRVCAVQAILDRWRLRAPAKELVLGHGAPSPLLRLLRWLGRRGVMTNLRKSLRPCAKHELLVKRLGADLSASREKRTCVGPFGLNAAGYYTTESGIGEAARLMARSFESVELPHVLINFDRSYGLRRDDRTYTKFSTSNPYAINLVQVNADEVPAFVTFVGEQYFEGKYNIGSWLWELPDFPLDWADRFDRFDEIWASSCFTAAALRKATSLPVTVVPYPLAAPAPVVHGRDHFGIAEDAFVFLFIFDFMSVFERKNPLATIEAFLRAFPGRRDVRLVIKCSNSRIDPENAARLRQAAERGLVQIIDGYLSRTEVNDLVACCDAYVSLHRSEGFGLTLAEAMTRGKPVIGTDFSGNTDFMNASNSFPVRCKVIELTRDVGPYRRGSRWAEADVDHAADRMRNVLDDRESSAAIGTAAAAYMAEHHSPTAVGATIDVRLRAIQKHMR